MTDPTTTPPVVPPPPAVQAAAIQQTQRNTRNIGRLSLGGSTVLSVTGAVPFIDWLFTIAIHDPASRPNLAVVSFIAGVVVAGVNLVLQLMLRGRDAVTQMLEGDGNENS